MDGRLTRAASNLLILLTDLTAPPPPLISSSPHFPVSSPLISFPLSFSSFSLLLLFHNFVIKSERSPRSSSQSVYLSLNVLAIEQALLTVLVMPVPALRNALKTLRRLQKAPEDVLDIVFQMELTGTKLSVFTF